MLVVLVLALVGLSAAWEVYPLSYLPFDHIPNLYACSSSSYPVTFPYGKAISPGFYWNTPPPGTQSIVFLMHDADTIPIFGFAFQHWAVVDIPPTTTFIPEGATRTTEMPPGAKEILNTITNTTGYIGFCPPANQHHLYRVTLFARSVQHSTLNTSGRADVNIATLENDGYTLAFTETVSIFP
eukprot:TRINITY_DN6156_c0_g1_i1.p1 TRINITY_DN6156_c0_g1~~TRINITY_DN6156_c0_g1_i1.p1  ORF type:complete len:183 (+),score=15.92 TRINITY_DN6156_c0_g1_i1:26-574(+)